VVGEAGALPLFKAPEKDKSCTSLVSRDLNFSSKSDVGDETIGDVQ
jgi:hypothetical protein